MKESITVETIVHAPVSKVWEFFTIPQHIVHWNNASPEWHTTSATNDLSVGDTFNYRMEAKDGTAGFNLVGTYSDIVLQEKISYTLEDGRNIDVFFTEVDGGTRVVETFEAEDTNPKDMQRSGWKAILDSFKAYVESN